MMFVTLCVTGSQGSSPGVMRELLFPKGSGGWFIDIIFRGLFTIRYIVVCTISSIAYVLDSLLDLICPYIRGFV